MRDRNISFSVKPSDTEATQLIEDIKLISIKRGISFSHITIQALKKYKTEVLDYSARSEGES